MKETIKAYLAGFGSLLYLMAMIIYTYNKAKNTLKMDIEDDKDEKQEFHLDPRKTVIKDFGLNLDHNMPRNIRIAASTLIFVFIISTLIIILAILLTLHDASIITYFFIFVAIIQDIAAFFAVRYINKRNNIGNALGIAIGFLYIAFPAILFPFYIKNITPAEVNTFVLFMPFLLIGTIIIVNLMKGREEKWFRINSDINKT